MESADLDCVHLYHSVGRVQERRDHFVEGESEILEMHLSGQFVTLLDEYATKLTGIAATSCGVVIPSITAARATGSEGDWRSCVQREIADSVAPAESS